jgi:CHAT domain
MSEGSDRAYLIVGMFLILFLLIFIVAGLAVWRPEALSAQRPRLVSSTSPEDVSKHIKNPKVLCASTKQFESLGFEEDVRLLKDHFKNTEVKHGLTSNSLKSLLATKEYDVIHLLAYVEPQSGNLVFSENDSLTSLGFAELIKISKAHLVILATCDSVDLAARVARTTNIIASTAIMQTKDFIEWAEMFYQLLFKKKYPISQAYEIATSTSNAPVVLLMKQDVIFE